jgi:Zn-dependent protease/CBS domain-containing protein
VTFEIHASSLVLLAGLAILLATTFFPRRSEALSPVDAGALGIASALLLFLSVLAHEAAHVVVAKLLGLRVDTVTLFFHAGHSPGSEEAPTPARELLITVAGPLVTFGLALASWIAWKALPSPRLGALLEFATVVNLLLGTAQLLPAFPFDGARAIAAVAWGVTGGRLRGARWSARASQLFALALAAACAVGVGVTGLGSGWTWGLLLAGGLWFQGVLVARLVHQRERLEGRRVCDVMEAPPAPMSRVTSVAEALEDGARTGALAWLVEDQGRLAATVGLRDLRSVPVEERLQTPVGQVSRRLERQHVVAPGASLEPAVRLLAREGLPILPVVHDGVVVGVLVRESVARLLDPAQ